MDWLKETKVVKNFLKKFTINLPRILTGEVYFKQIKEEFEDIAEREKRRANTKAAGKKIANAVVNFSDDLENEMFVYAGQSIKDAVVDEILIDPIKDIVVSNVDGWTNNNRK